MGKVTVARLLEEAGAELRLELVAGRAGLQRAIRHNRVQKHGLALAGFFRHLQPERVQVFGNTELDYFAGLPAERQVEVAEGFFSEPLACVVCTKGLQVPAPIAAAAERHGCPLLRTPLLSSTFIIKVQDFLADALTARSQIHGVLLDVFGVGVLLLGKSGIGKSEAALDLVMRGHRLVADDVVQLSRRKLDVVYGSGSPLLRHHMEIRGLGIINVQDLFGISSVRERKKIELVIELVEWDPAGEYDRLGVEERFRDLLDVQVPILTVPVRPGRNMATIIEVAARNQLLKLQGHHSARQFQERLERSIGEGENGFLGDEIE